MTKKMKDNKNPPQELPTKEYPHDRDKPKAKKPEDNIMKKKPKKKLPGKKGSKKIVKDK